MVPPETSTIVSADATTTPTACHRSSALTDVGDGALINQRPGRVVEEHLPVLVLVAGCLPGAGQPAQRLPRRVGPGGTALDDGSHRGIPGTVAADLGLDAGSSDHEDLVNGRGLVKCADRVLDQGAARQETELLGPGRAEPVPGSCCEHHRHRSHGRTLPGRVDTPGAVGIKLPVWGYLYAR